MASYVANLKTRREKREGNVNGDLMLRRKAFKMDKNVKSDLKKSTAFVKRIRATDKDFAQLVKDSRTLNLQRYTEEISSGVAECRCKPAEVDMLGELVEALEGCYEGFAKTIADRCKGVLKGKDALLVAAKDEKEKTRLRRLNARLLVEMMSRGLCDESKFLAGGHSLVVSGVLKRRGAEAPSAGQ